MLEPFGFALAAGVLSILSPCILPLVPIVLGTAAGEHRYGPAALAAGLAASFITIGLFVALIGFSIGLDTHVLRRAAAILLIGIGFAMACRPLHIRLAAAGGPVADWSERHLAACPARACSASSAWGCCSARSGALAWARRSARRP